MNVLFRQLLIQEIKLDYVATERGIVFKKVPIT